MHTAGNRGKPMAAAQQQRLPSLDGAGSGDLPAGRCGARRCGHRRPTHLVLLQVELFKQWEGVVRRPLGWQISLQHSGKGCWG